MVLAERLTSQLLSGPPASSAEEVTSHLLAVQAQDPRGARLAIRVRTSGLTAADIDRALDDRSLVITWLNRGTLHLVAREDYPWLHALTTPQLFTANARRLDQEGVSPDEAERAVAVVERSLAGEGPLTRKQLGERIAPTGVRIEGQALLHLLLLACLRGLALRGPMARRRAGVCPCRGLARHADARRPGPRARRARAQVPRRARTRERPRSGEMGRGSARSRASRASSDRPRGPDTARRARGAEGPAPTRREASASEADRPVRPDPARLDVAGRHRRFATRGSSRATASSGRSRWSRDEPSGSGADAQGRSSSCRSMTWARRCAPLSMPTPRT